MVKLLCGDAIEKMREFQDNSGYPPEAAKNLTNEIYSVVVSVKQ